jgi:stage II sporulation protein M
VHSATPWKSLSIIFLTTISCLYVVQGAIRMEERKEKNYNTETWMLGQHRPLVMMVLALFLGFVVSFTLWSFFLPETIGAQVFQLQQGSLEQIRSITGNAISASSSFIQILKNNLNVVLVSLVFALFFGAGAIYILVWNASIIGYVIGAASQETFGLGAIPAVAVKYMLHGIPEMLAYILAAIAGGIMYFSLLRGDLTKENRTRRLIIDFLTLLLIAILLLLLAAAIEVFISSAI